jgi:type IV pilus assembly protein PilM
MEKICTGVELGAKSIKIAQLKKDKGKIFLLNFAMGDIPSDSTKIRDGIKDMLKKKKIRPGNVGCVFPAVDIIIKETRLPFISEEELKKAILWQAEKEISFPIDEAVVDYQIIEEGKKADSEFEALLIIGRKMEIEREVNKLKSTGLIPIIVDIVPFTLVKSYRANYAIPLQDMIALLEIGENINWLVVIDGSGLKLVRSFAVSPSESEEIIREIELSINYCESKYLGEKVSKIVLSGIEVKDSGFDKFLSERLGMDVEIPFLFNKIEVIPGQEHIKAFSQFFMGAVGAAL